MLILFMLKLLRVQNNHLKGQATTEYILIIAFAVSFAVLLYSSFIKPMLNNLKEIAVLNAKETFKGDLHRLPPVWRPKIKKID